jgi:hypothetical protein
MTERRIFIRVLPGVSMSVALVGGLFVGQFSCGAHWWQAPAIASLVGVAGLSTVLVRARASASWSRGRVAVARALGFLVLVAAAFMVAEAVGASFYPAAPASLAEFLRSAGRALIDGPC